MNNIKYKHTREAHNTQAALEMLPFIFKFKKPKSIIDIGCGNGSWLQAAKECGVPMILGIDGIKVRSEELNIEENEFIQHDLTKPLNLNLTFDMAICLEVAEHLPETAAEVLVNSLTTLSDFILFGAAIPGQGGQFHINEQWPEYWHKKFKLRGYSAYDIIRSEFWDNPNVFWWYKQNTIIYAKNELLKSSGFQKSESLKALIHPELFRKKIFYPKYLSTRAELFSLIVNCLKSILKK